MSERLSATSPLPATQEPFLLGFRYIPSREEILTLITPEERVYLLPQTGFDIRRQIDMWLTEAEAAINEGKSEEEIVRRLIDSNAEDAIHFCFEYVYKRLVLPISANFTIADGERRIVPTKYTDRPYAEIITTQEREGVVKNAFLEAEGFLLASPPGSMAIFTSPAGWSGLYDGDGIPMEHADTQTYAFRTTDEGRFEGVTFRTDLNLAKNEAFVRQYLNLPDPGGTDQERIVGVMGNVIKLLPDAKPCEFDEVIDALEAAKGDGFAFLSLDKVNGTLEVRTFQEMRTTLSQRTELTALTARAEELITNYKERMESEIHNLSPEALKRMAVELGKTILMIFQTHRQNHPIQTATPLTYPPPVPTQRYQEELMLGQLQEIGGCAGGACNLRGGFVTDGLISPRAFNRVVQEGTPFRTNCPICGGKEVTATISGDIITGDCGHSAKKPQSIQVTK